MMHPLSDTVPAPMSRAVTRKARVAPVLMACPLALTALGLTGACERKVEEARGAQAAQEDRVVAAPKAVTPRRSDPLDWAEVIEATVDSAVVTDKSIRDAIVATGLPWRVRHVKTGIEMLLIPPGSFRMGREAKGLNSDASPLHTVTITSPFYLGRYEVTQEQWLRAIGRNPSTIGPPNPQERIKKLTDQWMEKGMTRAEAADAAKRKEESDRIEHERTQPVDGVTWRACAEFCRVSDLRLPTEAEWEYAYRAGTTASLHGFPGYMEGTDDPKLLANIAWDSGSSTVRSRKEPGYGQVGAKWANGLGVHDMAGNVSEWVSDWYQSDYYAQSPKRDPSGPSVGRARVIRGGDRDSGPYYCTAWARRSADPESESRVELIGLRVAKDP